MASPEVRGTREECNEHGRVGEGRKESAQQGRPYLTVGDAAKLLGVHHNRGHRMIPAISSGKRGPDESL